MSIEHVMQVGVCLPAAHVKCCMILTLQAVYWLRCIHVAGCKTNYRYTLVVVFEYMRNTDCSSGICTNIPT